MSTNFPLGAVFIAWRHWRLSQFAVALALVCVATMLGDRAAHAEFISYNVNLGTTGLIGQDRDSNGTNDSYRIDYFFNNGGTTGNSSAALSNFTFGSSGSGTAAVPASFSDSDAPLDGDGFPIATPAASGFLSSAGDYLNFDLGFNYTLDSPTPDQFGFAIFNLSDNQYLSTGSGDGISFLTIDFGPGSPNVSTYANQGSPGNASYALAAPTVTVTSTTVATPEPSTWATMAMGLAALLVLAFPRKKKHEPTV